MATVSVLLPVYNSASYVAESIESILSQTWRDFELIILNDGSQDESASIIKKFNDPRVRYFEHENRGLAATLNRGIEISIGKYLARQDADDISKPERLAKQVKYLETHPACGLIGTWADIWTESEPSNRALNHPAENEVLKLELLFDNPFVHSSVMMRKECLMELGGYTVDSSRQPPEDYELWSRFARRYELANIPEPLVIYREVACSLSRSADNQFWERIVKISQENLMSVLGKEYNQTLIMGAACLFHGFNSPLSKPRGKDLINLLLDIEQVFEVHYPGSRRLIRPRLKRLFHLMLHRIYAQYMGTTLAKYLVQLRSLCLFR